jgi:iron-sulfur cluster repair protein YtfE (RIC family)
MAAAAAGYLTPVAGAVLQEAIDLVVILNALRALGDGVRTVPPAAGQLELSSRLHEHHRELRPRIEELAALANRLGDLAATDAARELESARVFLVEKLLPHEQEEQRTAYPMLVRLVPGEDPTGPMIRTHHEIARLARLFARLVAQVPPEGPHPAALRDLRRILYGLHAVLTLHFAQEDELYGLLGTPPTSNVRSR